MKTKGTRLPRGFVQGLKAMTVTELEGLLESVELREAEAVQPLSRQKAAIKSVLKKQRLALVRQPGARIVPVDVAEAGLPVSPVIDSGDNPIGDINLLMNNVPITVAPFDRIIREVAEGLIEQTGGLIPTMEVKPYQQGNSSGQRFVVHWTIQRPITQQELGSIELIALQAYEREVSGHKENHNGWEEVVRCVDLQDKAVASTSGIYFGPTGCYDSEARGVTVYRRFVNSAEPRYLQNRHAEDWIARSIEPTDIKTEIEVREGYTDKTDPSIGQDKLLFMIVQIAYLLAKHRMIDGRVLNTAIYRELNRVGTNNIDRDKLYGMTTVLSTVERVLILPLQRPDLALAFRYGPESILLVGAPGLGKTFLAHFLMTGNYNAIFASVDSDRLRQDLMNSGDMKSVFLQIDRIKDATGLPVILLVDDIDVILDKEEIVSKFLNLMQGIRQRGFYILASTNHPEKIDQRLLEPGRLSKVVHVRLPGAEDRVGVLRSHTLALPFVDERAREETVKAMAAKTPGWTQRYLWELCVEAGRLRGMDISGSGPTLVGDKALPLTMEYFERARVELLKSINLKKIKDWDRRIAVFVSQARGKLGFR